MSRLSRILLTVFSVSYPLSLFAFQLWFQLPPRFLVVNLLALGGFYALAYRREAGWKSFQGVQFWLMLTLILGLALGTWLTDHLGWVKLYPLVMNAFLLAGFGYSLYRPPEMIWRFAQVQDPSLKYAPNQAEIRLYTRRVTGVWCGFFVLNGSIAAWTALAAPEELWALYNGVFSYIAIGTLIAAEWVFRHLAGPRNWGRDPVLLSAAGTKVLDRAGLAHRVALAKRRLPEQTGIHLATEDLTEVLTAVSVCLQTGRTLHLGALSGSSEPLVSWTEAFSRPLAEEEAPLRDEELQAAASDPWSEASRIVFHTSGSTGVPKAVVKSLSQLQTEVQVLKDLFFSPVRPRLFVPTVSPLHLYGFLFVVLLPFELKSPRLDRLVSYPETLSQLRQGLIVLVTSPAFLKRLDEPNAGLPRPPERVFSSGGALPEAAARRAQAWFGQAVTEIYGSTETGGIAWRRNPEANLWTLFPGMVLSGGGEESVWLQSPYLEAPVPLDDRLELGEGGFRLLGRADSVVKIEEKRVALNEVEHRLIETGWVKDAAVLAFLEGRQQLGAAVVLNEKGLQRFAGSNRRQMGQAFREALAAYFEPVALPRKWRFLEDLGRNAQGKLSKEAVRVLFD